MSDENFVKAHGLRIAKNGYIQNVVIENLAADPTVVDSGRIWYNSVENLFKGSFKKNDGSFIIKEFSTKEDLDSFIALLASKDGADNVGYAGYIPTTGSFSLSADNLTNTINGLIEKVSTLDVQGGNGINIEDESVQVLKITKNINFIGDNILAVQSSEDQVTVYVPAPTFAPLFNTDTAVIKNLTTTQRKISNNTGAQFKIGNWKAGSSYPALKISPLSFITPVKVGFNDKKTGFSVKILGDDDKTILAQNSILNISDNITNTSNNVTITVSDWEPDYFRFKANIGVSININAILPNGGRFSVELIHNNSTLGILTFNQGPLFFDPDTVDSRPVINNINITENTSVIKSISGIKYYTANSKFNIVVNDIDRINKITWPNDDNVIKINSNSEFGIPDHYLQANAAHLAGWTNEWNIDNLSSNLVKILTRQDFRFIGATANISCYWIDWMNGSEMQSADKAILIDTVSANSTNQNEEFNDEVQRLKADLTTKWNSDDLLSVSDLMVQSGKVMRQTGNWTTYNPTNTADYSASNTNTQFYYREFIDPGVSHSNGLFSISGITETQLSNGNVKIEISTNKTDWYDCSKDYTSGALSNGSGCRINKDTRVLPQLEFTLGTGGSTDASTGSKGFGIFVRISMPSNSTAQIDYFRITNW